jgi:hypothetical protein
LDDKYTGLETGTDSEASQDLVAEPFSKRRINVKRGNHTGTDGKQERTGDDDDAVVADRTDDAAGQDGDDDGGQEKREDLDASLYGTDTLDGLEIQG